jgi:hypothetical protein
MKRIVLGVAATLLLASASQAPAAYYGQPYPSPYYPPVPYPAYPYSPQAYSQFDDPSNYGYRPRGLPHSNGPEPGGGGCYMGQATSGCGDD